MPLTVRIDTSTKRLIERLARKKGQTKSDVIREAIDVFSKHIKTDRPFDAIRDLIGCVRGGPLDLSEQTGHHFRRILTTKHLG